MILKDELIKMDKFYMSELTKLNLKKHISKEDYYRWITMGVFCQGIKDDMKNKEFPYE
jgi:hypothetical protein